MNIRTFKYDPDKIIKALIALVLILGLTLVVQSVNLQDQRKLTIAQSNFCVSNTADMLASSQIALMREKDAHERDIDKANTKIEFLVNEYNKLLIKAKKSSSSFKQDLLNVYSHYIYPTIP